MNNKETIENNIEIYLIYLLEKDFNDFYIISNNKYEKLENVSKIYNLELEENKVLMNYAYVLYGLYIDNINLILDIIKEEKDKNEFLILICHEWKIKYGIFDEKFEEIISKINKEKYINALNTLHDYYEKCKEKIEESLNEYICENFKKPDIDYIYKKN